MFYGNVVGIHKKYPILDIGNVTFFRCVEWLDSFYGKTISELFAGNLRDSNDSNRYANLFPDMKLSYWSSHKNCAKKEIKKHGASNNIITFEAYDDASASFPTTNFTYGLYIINGSDLGFRYILDKVDKKQPLTKSEWNLIHNILNEYPDGISYPAKTDKSAKNVIFFESGFEKLSLRNVWIRLGNNGNNSQHITCSSTCDYNAEPKNYGYYFEPILKKKFDNSYLDSDEYKNRKLTMKSNLQSLKQHD